MQIEPNYDIYCEKVVRVHVTLIKFVYNVQNHFKLHDFVPFDRFFKLQYINVSSTKRTFIKCSYYNRDFIRTNIVNIWSANYKNEFLCIVTVKKALFFTVTVEHSANNVYLNYV